MKNVTKPELFMAFNHNDTELMNRPGTKAEATKEAREYKKATGNDTYIKPVTTATKKAMTTKQVSTLVNRLSPVVAKTEDAVMAAAFDGVRRRPVVAINEAGDLVVCCRRTAAKNGWTLEGTLFARNRTGKVLVDAKGKLALAPESKRAAALKPPARRVTDTEGKVVVDKKTVAKLARTVKEILA